MYNPWLWVKTLNSSAETKGRPSASPTNCPKKLPWQSSRRSSCQRRAVQKENKKSLEGVFFSSFVFFFGSPGHSGFHNLRGEWRKRSGWRDERVSSGAPPKPFPFTRLECMCMYTWVTALFHALLRRGNTASGTPVGPYFPGSGSDCLWAPGSGLQRELLSHWRTMCDVRHLRQNSHFCSLFPVWINQTHFWHSCKTNHKKKEKRCIFVVPTRCRAILLASNYKGILSQMWLWRYRFLGQFYMAAGSSAPLWYFHGAD